MFPRFCVIRNWKSWKWLNGKGLCIRTVKIQRSVFVVVARIGKDRSYECSSWRYSTKGWTVWRTVDILMKAYYDKDESPEHSGKAIVHLLNDQNAMSRSGQIELTTDLASEFRFKDVDGSIPIAQRSIKLLLQLGGAPKLASFIPAWFKLSKSLYFWLLEVAWPPLSNRVPSKYE